ncbi:MAG: cytochrome c biogenesis protein ResB, partial [Lachnospiraceae bacterium]|nr:cytochrome c biogenesis protein ResB [Lachnospiraceae bacterium]
MKFAIILLVILLAACAGGSFITQNQTYEWYREAYSERTAAVIMALRLDDVFHSWWFLTLAIILCGNLILCNLKNFPGLLRR